MEHNLEDSLNLGEVSDMGFEHCEDIVEGQVDITLETSGHDGDIPMEFEHIEEQPLLMDTGNEEIIDFMGDQFTSFQEYSVQDEQIHDPVSIVEDHQLDEMSSQSETMIDLQFDHQAITSSVRQDYFPKIVSVKAAMPSVPLQGLKKSTPVIARVRRPPLKKPEQLIPIRRQVPIAPKPSEAPRPQTTFGPKLAPKPVALVANRSLTKKVPLSSIVQGNAKGVLAQLGKQLVMVRSGGEQKIKLISTNPGGSTLQYVNSTTDQGQLISTKPISTSQGKPVMAKVIVQSSGGSGSTMSGARVVVQPRGQMLMTSPTKQGMHVAKKQQIIAIKSPTGKVMSGASQVPTTKKVVITSNPSQNVILKTTAPPKFTQVNKDGTVVTAGQRSQLHQINVPGKGIQYIRLITNQNPVVSKPSTAKPTISLPSKSFVLTDAKGNIIQIRDSAEKYIGDPPALLSTRIASKPQKKFVRIAPVPTKSTQSSLQPRSSQSLLAPLSPVMEAGFDMAELTPFNTAAVKTEHVTLGDSDGEGGEAGDGGEGRGHDTKHALHALVADTVSSPHQIEELEIEFEHQQSSIEDDTTQSMDADESSQSLEAPLIVIPSNYAKDTQTQPEDNSRGPQLMDDSNGVVNAEGELMQPYMSPVPAQPLSDTEYVSNELGLRPRKACNCTKSQCLKLYCDCFANGEFCNRCNCNNCHNNLENEELRQKAIRACLDRNPNAFRPKIGKSKAGGPEIIRRHNKGCNCKRSGCLKNYCECYEAKIACTAMCKCVGCRNVEDTLEWRRNLAKGPPAKHLYRPEPQTDFKQPCTFMTTEVIEAVCQCLLAAAVEGGQGAPGDEPEGPADPVSDVIDEFARCLQDIISASYQAIPLSLLDEGQA